MKPKSGELLVFDQYAIRLLIGVLAFALPWVVSLRAWQITPSISWSYHTESRDLFVGSLFVIGAFLISYKGRQHLLQPKEVGKFWHWVNKFWKGAVNFRIWERKREEDLVSWAGGIAAVVTALNPTAFCTRECPCDPLIKSSCASDPAAMTHYIGAIILFSTTVYFCLVAFRSQAKTKINQEQGLLGKGGYDPAKLRMRFYSICGWGIIVFMLATVLLAYTPFSKINNLTFWAETAALTLFGLAWLIASQYLPGFTGEAERKKSI
jgi:hypothetical protein